MRDEKEERKKQARSNKQTRQSNTAHPRQSLFLEKMSCLGWDSNRLGPNMLQNLPIILFHTAYFSHLLFSCFLPLFSYKIVFKVFLCTFVFRGEADCSVSSLIARWLPEQVSLAGRGVTRLLFARYLDLRLTLNCCCIGHPCPYCTC